MVGKKGQVWSIDLIIGLMIFALIAVIFYALLTNGNDDSRIEDYTAQAESISDKLVERGLIDADSGELNEAVYDELSLMTYDELKDELGVSGDFCIFFETNDVPPKLIVFSNKTGLGNSDFEIGGLPCGEVA